MVPFDKRIKIMRISEMCKLLNLTIRKGFDSIYGYDFEDHEHWFIIPEAGKNHIFVFDGKSWSEATVDDKAPLESTAGCSEEYVRECLTAYAHSVQAFHKARLQRGASVSPVIQEILSKLAQSPLALAV
jgi:hypothetical protein